MAEEEGPPPAAAAAAASPDPSAVGQQDSPFPGIHPLDSISDPPPLVVDVGGGANDGDDGGVVGGANNAGVGNNDAVVVAAAVVPPPNGDAAPAPVPAAPLNPLPSTPSPSPGHGRPRAVRLHFHAPPGRQVSIRTSPGGSINIAHAAASPTGVGPGQQAANVNNNNNNNNGGGQRVARNVVGRRQAHAAANANGPGRAPHPGNVVPGPGGGGGWVRLAGPNMLPPLEPRPVPNQAPVDGGGGGGGETGAGGGDDDGKGEDAKSSERDMKRFECAICFEYMENPVGCGSTSCLARFCATCLDRARRQEIHDRPPSPPGADRTPPDSAKCPHCRSPFTARSVALDAALRDEIGACTETATCPYAGCGVEMPFGMLRSHEAACQYVRMRCRYADWGCTWVGRKMDLAEHDAGGCEFRGGLGRLVEGFRQNDARAGHLLQQHHMQIGAQGQMLSLHARQIMMIRGRNAWNVFDVMQLSYETSFFPGRFSALRETWSGLITHQEARSAVCNVLLMVPSLALIFNVSLRGFKLLPSLQLESVTDYDVWIMTDALLLSLIVMMLGILSVACFFIDAKSPTDWSIYHVQNIIPGHTILRDVAAVCLTMSHFSAIEFFGLHPSIMLWHFTTIVTVFLPSFVSRVIEKNEPSAVNVRMLKTSRAWPVVIFGLRYGLLFGVCGFGPSANALVALQVLKETKLVSSKFTAEDSECFIPQIGLAPLIVVTGLLNTFDYATDFDDEVSWLSLLLHCVLALGVLLYANSLVFLLDQGGSKLGEANFHAGTRIFMQANQVSGAVVPNIKPSPVGCLVFGVCSFLLLCTAIA